MMAVFGALPRHEAEEADHRMSVNSLSILGRIPYKLREASS
jgi:hypothetical protein